MNIYERLPIFRLIEIIGSKNLSEISGVLEALNRPELDVDLINTRGFLSKYANQVFGYRYLLTKDGAHELLSSLSDEEIKTLFELLSLEILNYTREQSISLLVREVKNKASRRVISKYLGFTDIESDPKNYAIKPSELMLQRTLVPYKPLKDYQFEVFFKAISLLEERNSRFILQMPTGSGKTRTAIEIVSNFINSNVDCTVIWLAHSTELCDQASDCFLEVWPHLALKDITFRRHYGPHSLRKSTITKINFLCSSFQSLLSLIDKDKDLLDLLINNKILIIVDEAHKVVAPTYKKVTKSLLKDGAAVIGLTATPGRSYGSLNTDSENRELAEFFFDTQISFNSPGEIDPIEYLRIKKVLSYARLEPLSISGVNIPLNKKELDYLSKMLELPPDVLYKLGKNHVRNAEIIKRLIEIVLNFEAKSIIFFATSLEQSKLIASLLNFLNIKAEHVDGETSRATRELVIKKFRAQEIQVLCNYEVLSTGFDAPLVDCVFIARPTASVVLYSQMIGRGLRGPAVGGKSKCLIVNVRDNFSNLPSINTMYKIFDDYWTGVD